MRNHPPPHQCCRAIPRSIRISSTYNSSQRDYSPKFRTIRRKQLGWGEAKTVRHSPAVSRFLGRMDLLSNSTNPGANSVGGVGLLYDHYEQTSDGHAVSATSNDLAFGDE